MSIAEHDVGRWHIPAQTVEVYAHDATAARASATHDAHRTAGCPPWKPLLRMTYVRTAARPLARSC